MRLNPEDRSLSRCHISLPFVRGPLIKFAPLNPQSRFFRRGEGCARTRQKIFNSAANSSKFLQMAASLEPDSMIYSFDSFRVDARKRLLLRNGETVQLPSKAFDLLLTLIQSGGREISKDELMRSIWADQIVED